MLTWILIPAACAWFALLLLILHKMAKNGDEGIPKKKWWSRDRRVSKTAEELESTITEAVKAAPGCEAFVGVIVQRTTPKSRLDANWELRGIKFGRVDRRIAKEVLTPIVERMQREFRLLPRLSTA
jgi:hypothetical protein